MWKNIIISLSSCVLLLVISTATAKDKIDFSTLHWKLKIDESGAKIHTATQPGKSYIAAKSEIEFNVGLDLAREVIMDFSNYHKWVARLKEIKMVEVVGEYQYIVYIALDFPWPVSDRDACVLMVATEDWKTKSLNIRVTDSDQVPEQEHFIRLRDTQVEWTLTSTGPNSIHSLRYDYANFGGWVPVWLVNWLVADVALKTIENAGDYLEEIYKDKK